MTKVTEQDVDDFIMATHVEKMGAKTTVVLLTLKNGFEVVASSSCVDPNNYSHEIGAVFATKRAKDKVWQLLGFNLQCTQHANGV